MDFALTEEQQDVKALAEQIISAEATPEHLRGLEKTDAGIDDVLWQQLAEAGLLGIAIEEQHGGMGFDFETLCLLIEQVGSHVAPVPVVPVLAAAAMTLQQFGSDAQKQAWLPGIAAGKTLLVPALTEVGSDDPLAPRTELASAGDQWRLSGSKHMVPLADRAAQVLVPAALGDKLALVLVDPSSAGAKLQRQEVTTGEHQFELHLDNVAIDGGAVIAKGLEAERAITALKQFALAGTAVLTLGVTGRMLGMTAEYTAQREQFGRPIATFQAVSHRAADAYIDVECLRLACEQAVSLLSREPDATEAVTIAKIWACDVAHRVSQSAQHLHGGIGVDRDYPLFRYCLWAKQLELTLGGGSAYLAALGDALAEQFKAEDGATTATTSTSASRAA